MVSRTNISKAFLAMLLVAVVALAGCKQGQGYAISEEDEPNYRKGESLMRENRMDEALLAFEKVVDERRDSPESHLELGRIYMDHVKDPISAIYHFRKYLELRPQSEFSRQVAQLIESCKKDFARSLPGDPFAESVERSNVLEQMKSVKLENDELRRTVASLQNQLRTARPVVEAAPVPQTPLVTSAQAQQSQSQPQPSQSANGVRTYTVRNGDTLSKISTAVYGSPSRWQDIYNANRNQLRSPHDLKVGMILSIPR